MTPRLVRAILCTIVCLGPITAMAKTVDVDIRANVYCLRNGQRVAASVLVVVDGYAGTSQAWDHGRVAFTVRLPAFRRNVRLALLQVDGRLRQAGSATIVVTEFGRRIARYSGALAWQIACDRLEQSEVRHSAALQTLQLKWVGARSSGHVVAMGSKAPQVDAIDGFEHMAGGVGGPSSKAGGRPAVQASPPPPPPPSWAISGRVVDAAGQPVAGASVVVLGTSAVTRSRPDGRFEVSVDAPDMLGEPHQVLVQSGGRQKMTSPRETRKGENALGRIVLR